MAQTERSGFGSKLGVILATAGGAVGLGNVWRFPYLAGENGGAVFILIYIACVLLLGLPCMISEFIIGRHGASNTARAYTKLYSRCNPHYETSMALVTFCFGSVFGMVTVRMPSSTLAEILSFTTSSGSV